MNFYSHWLTTLKIIQLVMLVFIILFTMACWLDLEIAKKIYMTAFPYTDLIRNWNWVEIKARKNIDMSNGYMMLVMSWTVSLAFGSLTYISSIPNLFKKILINQDDPEELYEMMTSEVYTKLFFFIGYEKYLVNNKKTCQQVLTDSTLHKVNVACAITTLFDKVPKAKLGLLIPVLVIFALLITPGKGLYTRSSEILFYFGNAVYALGSTIIIVVFFIIITSVVITYLSNLMSKSCGQV